MSISPLISILPPMATSAASVSESESIAPVSQTPASDVPASGTSASVSISKTAQTAASQSVPEYAPSRDETRLSVTVLSDRGAEYTSGKSGDLSQLLMQEAAQLRDGRRDMKASSFMSRLGDLSSETNSYHNQARTFSVPMGTNPGQIRSDMDQRPGTSVESMTLTVTTKGGDTIEIKLNRQQVLGDDGAERVEFSFEVDGDLSEKEREALDKLAAKLGKVADDFFVTGSARLGDLSDLDTDVIRSFDLKLNNLDENPGKSGSVQFHYQVNAGNQTHQLKGEDDQGYRFDIVAELGASFAAGGMADGELAANQSFQQYIDLINTAGRLYEADSKSMAFFRDALSTMLDVDEEEFDEGVKGASEATQTEKLFHSNLPDFTASFESPKIRNEKNYSEISYMSLSMSQNTREDKNDEREYLQQRFSYDMQVNTWEPLEGMRKPDLESGYYIFRTQHYSEDTTRTLETRNGTVENLLLQRSVEKNITEKEYRDYRLVDERQDKQSDDVVVQQLEQINTLLTSQQQLDALDELLDSNNQELFVYH